MEGPSIRSSYKDYVSLVEALFEAIEKHGEHSTETESIRARMETLWIQLSYDEQEQARTLTSYLCNEYIKATKEPD